WTSQPLPETHPLIRPADYHAPYGYFWGPEVDASRDPAEKVAIVERSLRYSPPELMRLATLPDHVGAYEAELARAYVDIYAYYAQELQEAGRAEDAATVQRFVQVLAYAGTL